MLSFNPVTWYLNTWKPGISRFLDTLFAPKRAPLALFSTPRGAAEWALARFQYTYDFFRGAGDTYTHPQAFQYGLDAGKDYQAKYLKQDCDDLAVWALAVCKQIPGCEVKLINIIDGRLVLDNYTHTLCYGKFGGKEFIIDTNGYWERDVWTDEAIMENWNRVYASVGVNYVAVEDSDEPTFN